MTQPTRLIEEAGGDELETSLLQLARSEGPSAEGRRKILAAIAAGGAASLASQSAEAAGKAASKGALIKWGLVGAAALAIPAVLLLRGGDETPAPLEPAAVAAPTPAPVIEPKGTARAVDEGPAPLAVDDLPALKDAPAPAPNAPKPQGSLADEVAQLQKAKLALKSGNPSQALAELATYSQRFPRPMLGAEASVVRIEALSASGDAARAKSLAESFLAKNPNSPYATRLRNLTGAR